MQFLKTTKTNVFSEKTFSDYSCLKTPQINRFIVSTDKKFTIFELLSSHYVISGTFSDIAGGVGFEKRKAFFDMLDEVLFGRVERVVITYKDRLSRVGFDLFRYLFAKYNCEIVVMSEVGNEELDKKEVFGDVVGLLGGYSIKGLSSQQRLGRLKEVLCDDRKLDSGGRKPRRKTKE